MKQEPGSRLSDSADKSPLSHQEKLALLKKRLQEKAGYPPLSYNQQALWAFHQTHPGLTCYNLKFSARILGSLDTSALKRSLQKVLDRHAMLRTTYSSSEKGPVQQVLENQEACFFEIHDPGWSPEERKKHVQAAYQLPFDLEAGPVFRVHLFKTSFEDHVLLITIHHIACDGWSLLVILDELKAFYEAELNQIALQLPLPPSYRDFVIAQTRFINSEKGNEALLYWKEQLGGEPPSLDLPVDYPRQESQRHRGATFPFILPKASMEQFKRLAQTENVTLHTFFLTVFQVLLHRYSGQDEIVVGTPVSERDHSQHATTVGHFINPIAIRGHFAEDPDFRSLLHQIRTTLLNGLNRSEYPFPLLVKQLNPMREPGYAPVFQALMVMQKIPPTRAIGKLFLIGREEQVEWTEGLRMASFDFPEQEGQFDLILELREAQEGLFCAFKYNCDLFEEPAIARMCSHFQCLLSSVIRAPEKRVSELAMITEEERSELLGLHDRPQVGFDSSKCMHQLFEAQAARTPDAIALALEGQLLTYEELNRRANRLAHRLRKKGVVPDQLVGLLADRSFEMIVGILGILKTGGAYLPLDPDYPRQRLSFMLRDADIRLLLLRKENAALLGPELVELDHVFLDQDHSHAAGDDHENLNLELSSDHLAYAIYTSGSTGVPKGVLIRHANIHRLFTATEAFFHFQETDVWTLFHSFAFDFSVWEIWGALIYGGRLVMVPYLTSRSPEIFHQLLVTEKVTVLNQTPSAFRQLIAVDQEAQAQPLALRYVVFGGEQLDQQSLRPWFEKHGDALPQLINMYGITETTVHVTCKPLKKADAHAPRNPIGAPIPDLQLFILDRNGEPVPVGIRGELYVGGAGLAKGYLNRPDLTAERFCHPLKQMPELCLYKTGDVACRLSNGEIAYLGRNDSQVKLRGFRIELGEIESLLRTDAAVSDSLVLLVPTPTGPQLVAYVIAKKTMTLSIPDLRKYLQEKLPAHMVPAHFLEIAAIPLTPNAKIDKKALPLPSGEIKSSGGTETTTPKEQLLSRIWSEVLNVPQVGIHDNFFELGGDSINALQIIGKSRGQGLHFSVKDLFHCQTVYKLAAVGMDMESEPPLPMPRPFGLFKDRQSVSLPSGVEEAYPLSSLQLGMVFHTMALEKDGLLYHNINSFRLEGPFEAEQLKQAIAELMRRHSVLRTSIELKEYDEPVQLVHEHVPVPLSVEDLSPYSTEEKQERFESWFQHEKRAGFNLSQAPLFRFHVFIYSATCFELSLTEHHAILDGWSMARLMTELLQTYHRLIRGENAAPAPPPASSFRDYILAEKEIVLSDKARSFWEAQLKEVRSGVLPRWPAHFLEGRAGEATKHSVFLPEEVSVQLIRLSEQTGVPLKSILLSAHCYVLSVLCNQPQVITGIVANGRFEEADGDLVLGLFLNALPLSLQLGGGSWTTLIRDVFEKEKALLAYRRFPLLELQRLKQEQSLFDVLFNFTHFHVYELAANLEDIKFREARFFERTNYALTFHFNKHPLTARIQLDIGFDPGKVAPDQVKLIGILFHGVLEAIVRDPEAPYDRYQPSGTAVPYWNLQTEQDAKIYFGDGSRQYLSLQRYLNRQRPRSVESIRIVGHFGYSCAAGMPGTLCLGEEPAGTEVIYLPGGDLCSYRSSDLFAQQRIYWLHELDNLQISDFPRKVSRLRVSSSFQSLSQTLDLELFEQLKDYCGNANLTLPSFLLAALDLAIYLQSGHGDLLIGLAVSDGDMGKNATYGKEIVPIRVGISESKQMDVLAAEVQHKMNEAAQHSYPFRQLLEDLKEKTGETQSPVRTMAVFPDMPICTNGGSQIMVKGARIGALEYDINIDLSFVGEAQKQGLSIQLLYNDQALDASAAGKLLENYIHVLEQVVKKPGGPVGSFELKLSDEELEEQDEFLKSMYEL